MLRVILRIRRLSVMEGKEYVSWCVFGCGMVLKLSPKHICTLVRVELKFLPLRYAVNLCFLVFLSLL